MCLRDLTNASAAELLETHKVLTIIVRPLAQSAVSTGNFYMHATREV